MSVCKFCLSKDSDIFYFYFLICPFLHFCDNRQSNLHVTVSALVAAAVVWMSELPARLNPIILPLMASIKREQVVCWM